MLDIGCHACRHRFKRTAAQVLADGRCPQCASTDIDLASNVTAALVSTAIGPNPFCASGLHSECSGFMCDCSCHARTVSPAYTPDDGVYASKVAYETHCPYCGQEGCSPTCPGPSSTGTCPSCGGGMSDGKCNDPQGCGYGWSGDRGLTSDGEPRYAAKVKEITDSVLGSNPGMSRKTASSIAEETIRRYPKVLG